MAKTHGPNRFEVSDALFDRCRTWVASVRATAGLVPRPTSKTLEVAIFVIRPTAGGRSDNIAMPRPLIPHRSLPLAVLKGEILVTVRYSIVSQFENKVTAVV